MGSDVDRDGARAAALFTGNATGTAALERVAEVIEACGGAELRVARTQVGWARRRGFVTVWDPRRWLGERGAPVVVSVALDRRDPSHSWKQVVEVRPGLFQHHREVHALEDLDADLVDAIRDAYACAG